MSIEIKKCTADDIPVIIALMRSFAEYEDLGQYFEVTEERLHAAMFGTRGFVEGMVATDAGKPFAYALFYPYFASFRGQVGYYLEDIYIHDDYRRRGIGEAMLKTLAALAKSRGYERIDFQVLEWNEPAVRFYEKLGVIRDHEERHFKFIDEAFHRLADGG